MALLLLAEEAGLAACFLGAFRREVEVLGAVGAPAGRRMFGGVLVGHAAVTQVRAASLDRAGSAAGRSRRARSVR